MPECLESGDVFLGQNSVVLGNWYAQSKGYRNWAKAMVGHTQSQMDFYNVILNKGWSYSTFDILTSNKRDFIYNDMYANDQAPGKKKVQVGTQSGFFVKIPFIGLNEVNYPNGRYVMALDGNLSEQELLERAIRFQSGELITDNLECEERYFLTFWAKNDFTSGGGVSPGHAFISLAREDNEKQMTVFDGAWGFYPQNRGGKDGIISLFGEVPGEIVDEFKEKTPKDQGFTILVSKEEYEKVLEIKKQWSQKNYRLTLNDCITFVEEVARSIDRLKVPRRSRVFNKLELEPVDLGLFEFPLQPKVNQIGFFPRIFLEELIRLNKNSTRIQM